MHDNEQFKVPCFNSGCTNAQNNNQTYNCCQQTKLTNLDESTSTLAGIGSAQGTGLAAFNRRSMLEILMRFGLVYIC